MEPSELDARIVCPQCSGRLEHEVGGYACSLCRRSFAAHEGVPLLVLRGSETTTRGQLAFFDEETDAEFEIERPYGQPPLYSWLLHEKFRRSVAALAALLPGASVLTVCGGSGMDAEFLARRGASVVASDLSPGAAQRALERSRRHGVPLAVVVADVERLPFRARSFDVVYVHDGLHHLQDPLVGLREMARVAAAGVSVTEPARAAVTRLAVAARVAGEYEEAGNRVARVTGEEVAMTLRTAGFEIVRIERYAMFYRHYPGAAMRFFSHPATMPAAKAVFEVLNRALGRFGNKLTVQAVRTRRAASR